MLVFFGVIPSALEDREKIFVGGLPHHCTLEMLGNYFSKYGRITDAVVGGLMDGVTPGADKDGCRLPWCAYLKHKLIFIGMGLGNLLGFCFILL